MLHLSCEYFPLPKLILFIAMIFQQIPYQIEFIIVHWFKSFNLIYSNDVSTYFASGI